MCCSMICQTGTCLFWMLYKNSTSLPLQQLALQCCAPPMFYLCVLDRHAKDASSSSRSFGCCWQGRWPALLQLCWSLVPASLPLTLAKSVRAATVEVAGQNVPTAFLAFLAYLTPATPAHTYSLEWVQSVKHSLELGLHADSWLLFSPLWNKAVLQQQSSCAQLKVVIR